MLESIQTLKHISNIPIDVHLMVANANDFIDQYIDFKPSIITVHIESFDAIDDAKKAIMKIRGMGVKAGISINPDTSLEKINDRLPIVNVVLVMTIVPGFGGQKLIPSTLSRIKQLAQYREDNNLEYFIEADGGINLDTILDIKQSGVDIAVVGSAIVNSENKKEMIKKLKQ